MADTDGLRQLYGVQSVAGIRQGNVLVKNRRQDKRGGKKKDQPQEAGRPEEDIGDGKKHVDIKI